MNKLKKAQELKSKISFSMSSKKAQEEMVGLALILIILAVIILVVVSFTMKKSNDTTVESYEVNSFVQSFLDYTTNCSINYDYNYQSVKNLIKVCHSENNCYDGEDACEVLNKTIQGILNVSFDVSNDSLNKGYVLNITYKGKNFLSFSKGNITKSSREANQELVDFQVAMKVYN